MISFNFSKKKDTNLLQDSKFRDESTKEDEDEKDFVTGLEGNEIKGTKKKVVKKELVIPLIGKNEWRVAPAVANGSIGVDVDDKNTSTSTSTNGTETNTRKSGPAPLSLDEQAIQELLIGGSGPGSAIEEREPENIPLLLQNKIPDGYEEDDNMDVSLRPDQPTLEDYENVPIEEFGMGMLRGMGWTAKEGIGLKNKRHVEMLEPQLRPKGLGLGASATQIKSDIQNGHSNKDKDKKEEEVLMFRIGAGALIQRGPDKGMYGRIEAFDEDNNRVILKLAISGKMSAVSKFHIALVKETEYKTKSKVLNYNQFDEYKQKQDKQEKERRDREAESRLRSEESNGNSSRKRSKDDQERDSRRDHSHSHKDKEFKSSSSSKSHKSSSKGGESSSNRISSWVRPHLKVRFIDKKYKNGKHYEKKFVVDDVIEADRFVLRSAESGDSMLENICTAQVETVIPKEARTPVCILFGKQRGSVGELVDRNRKEQTAIVKIPDGGVYELSYDEICEFVGDPEEYY